MGFSLNRMVSMQTITKEKITQALKSKIGLSCSICEEIVNQIFAQILELTLLNKKLTVKNFGTFSLVHKNARSGINFQKNEKIVIAERNVFKFLPAKALKARINS
jgi:integration host factor subunit alpha